METNERVNAPASSGISNSVERVLSKASSSAHAAVDSIAEAADDAASKAKPAIDRAAKIAHQAVDKAAGAAAPTAGWLTEQGENVTATQKRLVADTSSYVSANPLKALGIAALAGFLLSRILR